MGTGDSGSNANAIRFTTDGQFASLNFTQGLRDDSGILPDMVQEFRVLTNATAEQGWSEGTGIELITKSGTNKFHGSAFEYLRNNVFDSRGFIPPKTPIERHNEFGGTFGGPIKKNKIFL
jgi:hypothetical protein